MITVNLLFKTRDFSELMGDLVILTLSYLVLYAILENLVGSKTKSKKNSRNWRHFFIFAENEWAEIVVFYLSLTVIF